MNRKQKIGPCSRWTTLTTSEVTSELLAVLKPDEEALSENWHNYTLSEQFLDEITKKSRMDVIEDITREKNRKRREREEKEIEINTEKKQKKIETD